ncbi:Cytochrome c oxidase subunit 5A [Entophlyctis luteolus]|nr:Cytochrome c oxidase subunit 5A [Entophlyctis luteolus]
MLAAARGAVRLVPVTAHRAAALSTRATAISIANIETRWGKLPEAEQGAIADRIAVAEKGDWKNLSLEEKRAGTASPFFALPCFLSAFFGLSLDWCGQPGGVNQRVTHNALIVVFVAKPAYFIAYGAHGARNPKDPNLNKAVLAWSSVFLGLSAIMYFYWETQKPVIRTMTPEWKAAEDARAIELKQNPFSGAYAAELKKNGGN